MQAPSSPSNGDRVELAKLNGALLYITVRALQRDVQTMHGPTDAITCDIAVLDGPNKGETFEDALIFPKMLVSQLSPAVGAADPAVLARLGQGIAKPGKSAPWMLTEPTPADFETGQRYEVYAAKQAAAVEAPF